MRYSGLPLAHIMESKCLLRASFPSSFGCLGSHPGTILDNLVLQEYLAMTKGFTYPAVGGGEVNNVVFVENQQKPSLQDYLTSIPSLAAGNTQLPKPIGADTKVGYSHLISTLVVKSALSVRHHHRQQQLKRGLCTMPCRCSWRTSGLQRPRRRQRSSSLPQRC